MKTTFKTVLSDLDDDVMNIHINDNEYTDIDIDKIKGKVFTAIHGDKKKSPGKTISKKFITLLIAAAILVVGTVGAFASGSIQAIFGNMMAKESNLNALGLYSGGNVTVSSTDPTLDVKLLGVTGDGEKFYSAIEITKKDGSPVFDSECILPVGDQIPPFTTEYTNNNGDKVIAGESFKFDIVNDNRSLMYYIETVIGKGDLQNGRMKITNSQFAYYDVDEIYESEELSQGLNENTEKFIEQSREKSQKLVSEHGLTWGSDDINKNNFWVIDNNGVRNYCKAHWQKVDLPFEISYDLYYDEDSFINVDLSTKNAPNIVSDIATKASFRITPVGAYLYGQCDAEYAPQSDVSQGLVGDSKCFKIDNINNDNVEIIMNDGTVYYLLTFVGGIDTKDEEAGVYNETITFTPSKIPERWWHREIMAIDTREISKIIICGDTVYSK